MCCSLSSSSCLARLRCASDLPAPRTRSVHTSCGKGCASVRVPEPPTDWEAWVEAAVELFLRVQQLPLFFGHHPVYPRILPHDHLSVLPNFRQTVAANQATDHPSQHLNSTFPLLLPSQPLWHNSGMTFRSWVSIGLTSVVHAIPAGENADQYFDHCSSAGVPPSGPRRTHRFPCRKPYYLIGSLVLDVRRVFSTAILIKNKLVPVLHHLTY